MPRDSCFEEYECLHSWYQPSRTLIATITRVNTLRDCAAECCKTKACVAYEWSRAARTCWISSSWWEKLQLKAYNGYTLCQKKQGKIIQGFSKLVPPPPSRAENKQTPVKLIISPSNTFNLKWENQILASETFYNC